MAENAGMEGWKTPDIIAWLHRNDLEAIAPAFEENEVTGLDLILLTEDELRSILGISKLLAAKVKRLVNATTEPQGSESDDDPAAAHDFQGTVVPRISDRDEDLGDDEAEREELRKACTGVSFTAGAAGDAATGPTAAPTGAPGPIPPGAQGPAAHVPLLPTGTGALQLDSSTVERYQRSVATISTLEAEQVQQQLPAVRSRLAATQKRLKLQQTKFEELRQEEAKANEKLDKLVEGKWYPGKYLFGTKKHEDKVQRNTDKLEKVSNQVRAAGNQLEELHRQAEEQSKLITELTAKCAALEEARGFCAALLQSAFAGGAVGDARENTLEVEVASLGPKMEEVRRYKAVYGKAYELMRGSREAIEQAQQLLEAASRLATVDVMGNVMRPGPMRPGPMRPGLMRNTPGGLMVDMMKRARMRQGVELCKVSGELAIKARGLVPDMPRVKAEKLQKLRVGLGLMDVVFDNMISDLIVARKIRDMLGTAREIASDIKYAERWLEGWIRGRIDEDLRNMEALLTTRRAELHSHRMTLLHQWIDARSRGAVHEAPSQQPAPYGYGQQPMVGMPAMGTPAMGTPAMGMPAQPPQRHWVL